MPKKKIIKMNPLGKPGFCKLEAKRLSDFLNTKITFDQVLTELSLYEWGKNPADKVLSHYIISDLEDCVQIQKAKGGSKKNV